jgi:cholesterol oxidase
MVGTVVAPALSPQPMMATEGVFNLLAGDPERVDARQMRYQMKMTSEEGRQYYFEGFKVIHNEPGPDLWADTTTLYVTVHDGDNVHGPVMGKGILTIAAADFMRQMTTMQVTNATGTLQRLEATASFGRFFAGTIYEIYGGIFVKPQVFNPGAPPREKRPLRVSVPDTHHFRTADGVQLRLIRYRGGPKGPVMLSHGLGVSSKIFSIDTIETNLLEYLWAQGYDVWLLDYRASTDLPASSVRSSADDIAANDYPAAVATVRRLTGADTIQVVVHCYGSVSFFMAMLSGLQGVRSAVCSQIGTHVVVPESMKIVAGLHLPGVLDHLGVDSLTAYVDTHANWLERLYDRALSLYPIEAEERCTSATCHRISFMYSPLYEHDQLNEATHDALHEMFGVASIGAFEQLGAMARAGHLVSASGADIYLPHLERLAIPIAFIHGAENKCFMPKATELAYNMLIERNGAALYSRHVIPNYGHIDCIFGKNAVNDVYPFILSHLEKTAAL